MEDFVSLINSIYKDKEQFPRLIELMNPLINKYARTLYKDEKEDVRSELIPVSYTHLTLPTTPYV